MPTASPSQLGRYEIQAVLGRGSMGVVYLARDPLIGRLVALKTFRPNLAGDDDELDRFRARFLREAQSAGILSHPNIVTVHDVVELSQEGATFIAMEYVQGTNLKEVLRYGKPLDLGEIVDAVTQVAAALDYAHEHKVVHRDVKPANVLLTPERQVKLTDFGIAQFDTSNLTHAGQLLGTPNYMSPEQVQGREVDHRTDLFSLGVIVFEMITRHKPFAGENLTVVTHRIVYDDYTPVERYVGGMPDGLKAVLDRALAKDPERRFQSAGELADELARVIGVYERQVALSETQSITDLVVPPPPGDDGVGADTLPGVTPPAAGPSTTGSSTLLPPPTGASTVPPAAALASAGGGPTALTAALPRPPAPAAAGGAGRAAATGSAVAGLGALAGWLQPAPGASRPGWLRLTLVAVLTVLLVLVPGLLLLRWLTPASTDLAAYDAEHRLQVDYLELLRDGLRYNRAGDPAAAAVAFRRAESLRPDDPRIQRLRRVAEQRVQALQMSELREMQAGRQIEAAEQAYAAGRYEAALTTAELVLELMPGDAAAQDLARRSRVALDRDAQRRQEERRRSEEEARRAAVAAAAETAARAESQPAAEPAATEAFLSVRLETEGEGRLVIHAGERLLADVGYEFVEKKGLFSRKRPYRGETKLEDIAIDPGAREILYEVRPSRGNVQTGRIEGDFAAGATRTLVLVYDPGAGLVARLE